MISDHSYTATIPEISAGRLSGGCPAAHSQIGVVRGHESHCPPSADDGDAGRSGTAARPNTDPTFRETSRTPFRGTLDGVVVTTRIGWRCRWNRGPSTNGNSPWYPTPSLHG
jgi:hypothetical protein